MGRQAVVAGNYWETPCNNRRGTFYSGSTCDFARRGSKPNKQRVENIFDKNTINTFVRLTSTAPKRFRTQRLKSISLNICARAAPRKIV